MRTSSRVRNEDVGDERVITHVFRCLVLLVTGVVATASINDRMNASVGLLLHVLVGHEVSNDGFNEWGKLGNLHSAACG